MVDMNTALTPRWLHELPPKEKELVQTWLVSKGVVLETCAGVYLDLDGMFHAKVYIKNADGKYEIRDGVAVWDEDIIFRDTNPPDVVRNRIMGVESPQHRPQKGST